MKFFILLAIFSLALGKSFPEYEDDFKTDVDNINDNFDEPSNLEIDEDGSKPKPAKEKQAVEDPLKGAVNVVENAIMDAEFEAATNGIRSLMHRLGGAETPEGKEVEKLLQKVTKMASGCAKPLVIGEKKIEKAIKE